MTDLRGDLDARRASFLSVTDDYDRARPGYPTEAIHWIAGDVPKRIVDLGCGPGKLTSQLVELGHDAVGVDPSTTMLRGMLKRRLPAVRAAAEAIPMRSRSVDVVTAAQAFHWFYHGRSLPEIHRVLKTDGCLGLLWNLRDERSDWVRELSAIIGSEDAMSRTIGDRERFGDDPSQGHLRQSPLFGDIEHKVVEFRQELDRERLLGLVRSRSYVATLPADERSAVLDAVDRLCGEHRDLAERQRFILPYKTHAFRIRVKA